MAPPPAAIDPHLPPTGTILARPYRGQLVQVQVLTDSFAYAGRGYPSLSAIAKAITGSHTNGFLFFRCAMTPAHTTHKGSQRYRYYTCVHAQKSG